MELLLIPFGTSWNQAAFSQNIDRSLVNNDPDKFYDWVIDHIEAPYLE